MTIEGEESLSFEVRGGEGSGRPDPKIRRERLGGGTKGRRAGGSMGKTLVIEMKKVKEVAEQGEEVR